MITVATVLLPAILGLIVFWLIMRGREPDGGKRATMRFAAIWLPLAILIAVVAEIA
jgi:hypothetical protein